eukprot:g1511.t1
MGVLLEWLRHDTLNHYEATSRRLSRLQLLSPVTSFALGKQFAMLTTSDTVRHVIAGSIARTMAQTFIHPIDTIKTRLQVRSPPKAVKTWKKSIKKNPIEVLVKGKRVIRVKNWLIRGPRDVYLGVTGSILGTLPVGLAYFAAYECCKTWLESTWESMKGSPIAHFISGSVGAVVSCVIRVPTDTIRHRVQAYVHPNVFQSATTIVRTEGVRGLYAGFLPTLLRDVPELALQFTIYERLRKTLSAKRHDQKLQTWEHLVLGGLSGAVAAVVTMPFDVAKTTIQCGTKKGSLSDALIWIYKQKGVRGLFAGLTPRVTQVSVNSAAFFALFEICKMSLKPRSVREPGDSLLKPKIFQKPRKKIYKRMTVIG